MAARRSSFLAVALLTLAAADGAAQQPLPMPVYEDLNQAIIEGQVVPASLALASAADALVPAMDAYCAAPGADALDSVRMAFHETYDRWMAVAWVNFGPQALQMRPMRLHFWPDGRNTLGRQLAGVLNMPREDLLEQATLAEASVALQGLPALERLLFDDAMATDDAYACALAVAIAANVRTIATNLAAEWGEPERRAETLPDDATLTANLFQAINEHFALILTRKMGPVLGNSADQARPRLAENWRSERALRNITINVSALLGVMENSDATGFADILRDQAGDDATAAALVGALEEALAIGQRLEGQPVADLVVDESARAELFRMGDAIHTARQLWAGRVGPVMGLSIGFNSLDGD